MPAAPSQNETLAALCERKDIDWTRVNAYHMDEYIGLAADAPQRFGTFLKNAIFGKLPFRSVNYIDCTGSDPEAECARYAALLEKVKIDVVMLGIGENGHIAFNDPPVADFDDKRIIKPVSLDEVCRNQQINDGCFASLSECRTRRSRSRFRRCFAPIICFAAYRPQPRPTPSITRSPTAK